jgi:hypothetical protein
LPDVGVSVKFQFGQLFRSTNFTRPIAFK